VNDVTIRFKCVTPNSTWRVTFDQQTKKQNKHGQSTLYYRRHPDPLLAHRIFRLQRWWNHSRITDHRHYRHSFKGHFGKSRNKMILKIAGCNDIVLGFKIASMMGLDKSRKN
jgi:hypothetical protein